jgi:hypothetical protein
VNRVIINKKDVGLCYYLSEQALEMLGLEMRLGDYDEEDIKIPRHSEKLINMMETLGTDFTRYEYIGWFDIVEIKGNKYKIIGHVGCGCCCEPHEEVVTPEDEDWIEIE